MPPLAELIQTAASQPPGIGQFLLVACLVISFPVYHFLENKFGKTSTHIDAKRNFYLRNMLFPWIVTVAILLMVVAPSRLFYIPETAPNYLKNGGLTDVFPILLAAFGLVVTPFLCWKISKERTARYISMIARDLEFQAPTNRGQTIWFMGVAISTAFCHEIAFRGFCLTYFSEHLTQPSLSSFSFWIAIGISCVVYAVACTVLRNRAPNSKTSGDQKPIGEDHVYRFLFSLVFSATMFCLFTAVNSLWLPIIVHALCRMATGLLPAKAPSSA